MVVVKLDAVMPAKIDVEQIVLVDVMEHAITLV